MGVLKCAGSNFRDTNDSILKMNPEEYNSLSFEKRKKIHSDINCCWLTAFDTISNAFHTELRKGKVDKAVDQIVNKSGIKDQLAEIIKDAVPQAPKVVKVKNSNT